MAISTSTPPDGGPHGMTVHRRSPLRALMSNRAALVGAIVIGLFVVTALAAPWLAPHDPERGQLRHRLQGPNTTYLMGTDSLGRDILSRILFGARVSLMVAVTVVGGSMVIGCTIGLVAGYKGGAVDNALMRVMDVVQAFPGLLLAIGIVSILGPGLANAMLAVGISRIPQFARVQRAVTMVAKEQQYVEANRATGASQWRTVLRHILPNTLSPIAVLVTIDMGTAILVTSTLGFLGLGAVPPTPEWGVMLSDGRDMLLFAPHVVFFPGLAIALVVLGFNLLGDGIRDVLDPRMMSRQG